MMHDINLDAENDKKPILRTKLFDFTKAEERAMQRVIRSSIEFMGTFGQAPAQPQIDLSHYENSIPEPQCQKKKNTK